jgi:hypothetical protein
MVKEPIGASAWKHGFKSISATMFSIPTRQATRFCGDMALRIRSALLRKTIRYDFNDSSAELLTLTVMKLPVARTMSFVYGTAARSGAREQKAR